MASAPRVVFDCNTFLQAFSSPRGPAGRCMQLSIDGELDLFVSTKVLSEFREVSARPKVIRKLHLENKLVEKFIEAIEIAATLLDEVPEVFSYERDPDDAHYVNLALAANAKLIVSRDKDLLDLMDATMPAGSDFLRRFESLRIITPVELLREVEGATRS